MLLISMKMDELSSGAFVHHVVKRFVERACNRQHITDASHIRTADAAKLFWLIDEINLWLPDDWRMTRTKNNFRIFVDLDTVDLKSRFVLAGETQRCHDGGVLHVIRTVYRPHWLDKVDREHYLMQDHCLSVGDWQAMTDDQRDLMNDVLARDHPGLVSPNLYFFKPPKDDCPSPLFARQFERRLRSGSSWDYEFHRIHPLTQSGIDQMHYRWVKWSHDGSIVFVRQPEPQYRSPNYWQIPLSNRKVSEKLKEQMKTLFHEYGVNPGRQYPSELVYETEFKWLYTGGVEHRVEAFELTIKILKENGLTAESRYSQKQTDIYLDDDNFTLLLAGASLRMRRTSEVTRVTFKFRPLVAKDNPISRFVRHEEEVAISDLDAKRMLDGKPINAPPYTSVKKAFIGCGQLKPKVKVETDRETMIIMDDAHNKAEVCFDFARFFDSCGDEKGKDVEIEIESKGLSRVRLAGLADLLDDQLNMSPSPLSKYERAFEHYPELLNGWEAD